MLDKTIIDLWHISKTALCMGDCSRHSRMLYIKKELTERYTDLLKGLSGKQLWLHIEQVTVPTY